MKWIPHNLDRVGDGIHMVYTKSNVTQEIIKSILLPIEVTGGISDLTAGHQTKNFDKTIATIQAMIYLMHDTNPELAKCRISLAHMSLLIKSWPPDDVPGTKMIVLSG